MKKLLIISGIILLGLLIVWAFLPDYLFLINIYDTYLVFEMDTVVLFYLLILAAFFGFKWIGGYLRTD